MTLFFRADDLGWEAERFERLASLFAERRLRLNAAAIPLACSATDAAARAARFGGLLEVHSHGLAHLDREPSGKKSEFGAARRPEDAARDLARSRETLRALFAGQYYPAFVPPWNRIADSLVPLLPAAGFKVLSRAGAPRAAVAGLAELNVTVDLHTSRLPVPNAPRELLDGIDALGQDEPVGVMLHHGRMAERDFGFLAGLLDLLVARGDRTAFLSELAS